MNGTARATGDTGCILDASGVAYALGSGRPDTCEMFTDDGAYGDTCTGDCNNDCDDPGADASPDMD